MAQVRIKIAFNGRWEVTADGGCKYVGLSRGSPVSSIGMIVSRRISYEEFYRRVSNIVQCDFTRFKMELKAMDSHLNDGTFYCLNIVDEDVLNYVLWEDRFTPQICVDMVERIHDDDFEVATNVADNFEYIDLEQTIPHVEADHIPTDIPTVSRVGVFGSRQRSNQVPHVFATTSQPHICPETSEDSYCGTFNDMSQQSTAEKDCQTDVPHEACPPSQQTYPVYNGDHDDEVGRSEETGPSQNASDRGNEWVIPGAERYSWQEVHRDIRPTADIDGIFKGKFFPNKKDIQRVLGLYAVENKFEFKVHRSTKSLFHVVCKELNCTWKCRAVRLREGTFWEVRGWVAEHSCCLDEVHRNHKQASSSLIGELFAPKLSGDHGRVLRPKDIITDMRNEFGIQVLYGKALKALQYALSLTYGSPENSYQLLPSYCHALKDMNPGTVTSFHIDNDTRFMYFFMCFGSSRRAFRTYLRPIIAVDGTHLKSRFKGTMFVAAAYDGNDQIFPLAFGIGDTENTHSWTWFLTRLREAIGQTNGLMFVSDHAASIEEGISFVFPKAEHVLCLWHISQNLIKTFHRTDITEFFWLAAHAYTVLKFNKNMEELKKLCPGAFDYLMQIGPRKWSRVHCPLPKYDLTTINIAESLISCLRSACHLPVTTLVEFIRNMTQRWHYDRNNIAMSWKHPLSAVHQTRIMENKAKSDKMIADPVALNIFNVKSQANQWTVDLERRTCTCQFFQREQLPCSHALCAIDAQRADYKVYCAMFYRRPSVIATYSEPIMPVGGVAQWEVPNHIRQLPILPPIRLPQFGHPRRSRIPSSVETQTRKKCRHCESYTHPNRNYPNQFP